MRTPKSCIFTQVCKTHLKTNKVYKRISEC
jgi:hypothetical protein